MASFIKGLERLLWSPDVDKDLEKFEKEVYKDIKELERELPNKIKDLERMLLFSDVPCGTLKLKRSATAPPLQLSDCASPTEFKSYLSRQFLFDDLASLDNQTKNSNEQLELVLEEDEEQKEEQEDKQHEQEEKREQEEESPKEEGFETKIKKKTKKKNKTTKKTTTPRPSKEKDYISRVLKKSANALDIRSAKKKQQDLYMKEVLEKSANAPLIRTTSTTSTNGKKSPKNHKKTKPTVVIVVGKEEEEEEEETKEADPNSKTGFGNNPAPPLVRSSTSTSSSSHSIEELRDAVDGLKHKEEAMKMLVIRQKLLQSRVEGLSAEKAKLLAKYEELAEELVTVLNHSRVHSAHADAVQKKSQQIIAMLSTRPSKE